MKYELQTLYEHLKDVLLGPETTHSLDQDGDYNDPEHSRTCGLDRLEKLLSAFISQDLLRYSSLQHFVARLNDSFPSAGYKT